MNKTIYAGTSFDIPSDKWFWKKCGELDSIVEFQECTHRSFLKNYSNESNGKNFGEYCFMKAKECNVDLGVFQVSNYTETLFGSYLITSIAAFDSFLNQFVNDAREVGINIKLKEWKKVGKRSIRFSCFEQVCRALKNKGIIINFECWNQDLYRYYKSRRNVVSHNLDASVYSKDLQRIQKYKADINARYRTINDALRSDGHLTFDDFRLCTANLKNIAHLLTLSLESHVNWLDVGKSRPCFIPYNELKCIHFDDQKRINIVRKAVETRYGISLSDKQCKAFL